MVSTARRHLALVRAAIVCVLAACLAAVGALAFAPSVAFATFDSSQQYNTVKVGVVEQAGSAQRDQNGVLRGFDAEFMNRVAQYAGFDMQYTFYSDFNELLDAVEKGEV